MSRAGACPREGGGREHDDFTTQHLLTKGEHHVTSLRS